MPPSLATVTSEIPAEGLLGLVLRPTVHIPPSAKLWGAGPGNPNYAGGCIARLAGQRAVRGLVTGATVHRPSGRAVGDGTRWAGCGGSAGPPRGSCRHPSPLFSSPSHRPLHESPFIPSCCSWPARAGSPEPSPCCSPGVVPQGQRAPAQLKYVAQVMSLG